ncbi:hypothetical protein LZC95_11770 [Pendulispora brunnea]|uniref:Lipoprotein n=1 Tax=Pendulispora brunnea TaxID=2905690 RepID=A0ABZ2KJL1_9BACT
MKMIKRSVLPLALLTSVGLGVGACSSDDDNTSGNPGGKIEFSISGEALAYTGYNFPGGDPVFVDGWALQFERVLTTVDHITLSRTPFKNPNDQFQTDEVRAQLDGPWAVDLHRQGTLEGKSGNGETAVLIGELANENRNGGASFNTTEPYAFGFDVVPATANAKKLNLDDAASQTDYQEMIQNGYTTLFVGTATFRGTDCKSSRANYDFEQLPKVVNFRFGFKTPARYINCQNPEQTGGALGTEEHQRGVQVLQNKTVTAQLTLHTDHIFWDSTLHDSPLHFDHIAARYVGQASPGDVPTASLADFENRAINPVVDGKGNPVPWRSCVGDNEYKLPSGNVTFEDNIGLQSLADFLSYNERNMGHLNADGLCAVKAN